MKKKQKQAEEKLNEETNESYRTETEILQKKYSYIWQTFSETY